MTAARPPAVLVLRALGTVAAGLAVLSAALAAATVGRAATTPWGTSTPDLRAAVLVAIAALVPLTGWVWIARRNAGLLAPAHPFRFGPLAAAIAVTTPVSHLWWARPVLVEITEASAPPGEAAAASRLVRSWWACLVGGAGSLLLQPVVTQLAHRGPATRLLVWTELAAWTAPMVLLPAAAVLFALLVGRIGRWQHHAAPVAVPVAAPPGTPRDRPAARITAVLCGAVTVALLLTAAVGSLAVLTDGYLLPAGRPSTQRAAAAYLITAAAVTTAVVRLLLRAPAGARTLVTALCWAAFLGLCSGALPRLPDGWDVAATLVLVASAVTGLLAADRVDRSTQPKNALRRWLSSR